MRDLAVRARAAARQLATLPTRSKDRALLAMAAALVRQRRTVLRANALDLKAARTARKGDAFLDRLALDSQRLAQMAAAIEEIARLPDPIGEVVSRWKRPNGLAIQKVRLPLGVVLMIYEARPNVTSDAAALCLKSGNAALLRGGAEALRSDLAIAGALAAGLAQAGLPADAIQLVRTPDRQALRALLQLEGLIDLCIPRGGAGLSRFVAQHARIPVVKHAQGVCHVYVDKQAALPMATRIIVNAKAQRPGVCNAAECLLVDRAIAPEFLGTAGTALVRAGVQLRACPTSLALLQRAGVPAQPAAEDDFGREFLDLVLAVRVVRGLDGALAHIARYGSEHTEAIVTQDKAAAARFTREVAASAVVVNASTRFNDGGQLGLGAEIGISTSRLHAFGPMGLRELTSQKYVVHGRGQIR